MATSPVLDVEALLVPIAGEKPAGKDLAYDADYDEIRETRRSEDDAHQGDWQRSAKVAEWDRVIELCSECLKSKTKDLQIAAWMTEALARLRGFAGLRDGLRLLQGIQERFWETYYPALEAGDLESRGGPFLFLSDPKVLPFLIRSVPLTAGVGAAGEHYSYLRWQESRATENAGLKSPDLMAAMIAEGKITSKQFDEAVAQTPRRFYEDLVDDLNESWAAFKEFDQSTDHRFGRDAPSMVNVRKALEECRKLLEPILKAKRQQEPDEEASDESEPAEEAVEESAEGLAESTSKPRRAAKSAKRGAAAGPIASAADAQERVLDAAAYLRQNSPTSPVPYLLVRALRMAEVYGMPKPPNPAELTSPTREVRQNLKRLSTEGPPSEFLEQAEQCLGRPEGRAWLDAQRYAIAAMAASEHDLSQAATAARGFLRTFLTDFPELSRAELDDGTPAANVETLAWLESEILPPPFATEVAAPLVLSDDTRTQSVTDGAEPDAWERALDEVNSGQISEAIQRMRRTINTAQTGRDKFRRKLQLAELCLMVHQPRVALPLLDDLARQIDEYRLEQWEDEALSARVWGTLYRCLRSAGNENGAAERMQHAYTRLCRLDTQQALMYGSTEADS